MRDHPILERDGPVFALSPFTRAARAYMR